MRISDWSADVCSSDLVGAHRARPGRQPIGRPADEPGDRPVCDRPFANQAAQHKKLAVIVRGQIGRASCRESVCQYVWISVVAVSFKKQKAVIQRLYPLNHISTDTN